MIAFLVLFSTVANAKVKDYGCEIPWQESPNEETIEFYLDRYLDRDCSKKNHKVKVKADTNYIKWYDDKGATTYEVVTDEMSKDAIGLLSYMKYDNGKITIDQTNDKYDYDTSKQWHSQSVGKSVVSYMTGHAICKGYIDNGINHLVTMPMIENTLYNNQKLIDLLNMNAGDQHLVGQNGFVKHSKWKWINEPSVPKTMKKVFKGSEQLYKTYNYNNLVPNLIFTYLAYKTDDEFEDFLQSFFNKVGIENDVFFVKQPEAKKKELSYWYYFFATKYDYMRLSVEMLNDWNNNTCEGQYLKSLYENRIQKHNGEKYFGVKACICGLSTAYGGQFHMELPGARNREMFLMDGYGGNVTVIDFENNKILQVLSVHRNYDWKTIIEKEYVSW